MVTTGHLPYSTKWAGPDGRTLPDWLVVPDSAQPNAWRLLHYAGKGGARFSVGSTSRYPPGQEADAAHKAKKYQFEALHKIYFYDAWRSQPELGTRGSDLHLPPQPGLLQAGCYWPQQSPAPAIDVSSGSSETAAREQEETGMLEKDSEDRADEAQHVQTPSSAEADAEADAWDCASDFVQ